MKTIKKQVEESLKEELFSLPNREALDKIARLERIVIKLAEQIDILTMFKKDAYNNERT